MSTPPPESASATIAHVTTAHQSRDNRIFRKECVSLAAAGFQVHLVAVAEQSEVDSGVSIEALPRRHGRLQRMTLGPVDAWRALRRIRPSAIHVHDPELVPLAIAWKLLTGRPAVLDAHEDLAKQVVGKPYIPRPARRVVAHFARLLERLADTMLSAIVAATPAIARNFHRAPVVLVQNFPWLREFPEPSDDQSEHHISFCYVGGLSNERGAGEMIRVVQNSPREIRLVVAGGATPDVMRALSSDRSGRVEYRGLLPATAVPDIVRESDAGFVLFHPLPNHLEAQPTKLFEYMAAGKPFIASDFQVWRDLLGAYDCGYFVDPLDERAIGAAVDRIVELPQEAREKGARGRKALVENFTFEAEAQNLVTLTRRLVGKAGLEAEVSAKNSAISSTEGNAE